MDFRELLECTIFPGDLDAAGISSIKDQQNLRQRSQMPLPPSEAAAGKPTGYKLSEAYGVALMAAYTRNSWVPPVVAVELATKLLGQATDDDHEFCFAEAGSGDPVAERARDIVLQRDPAEPWLAFHYRRFADQQVETEFVRGYDALAEQVAKANGFGFTVVNLTGLFETTDRALALRIEMRKRTG